MSLDLVSLTDPAWDGAFWLHSHLMSHNQGLCVYRSSVEHSLLFFERDTQSSVLEDMALIQNIRELLCDSSQGLP